MMSDQIITPADRDLAAAISTLMRVDDAGAAIAVAAIKRHFVESVKPHAVENEVLRLFPTLGQGMENLTEIEQLDWNRYGSVKAINNSATDLPAADIGAEIKRVPLRQFGNFFQFSTMELSSAIYHNVPLSAAKSKAAVEAHFDKVNEIFWEGDASIGLTGFANHNFPTIALPADGTGSSVSWRNKTATQIVRDMKQIVNSVAVRTQGRVLATRLLMSNDAFELAETTLVPGTSDSALSVFRRDRPDIDVKQVFSLKSRGGVDVLADNGGRSVGIWLPMLAYQHSPQQDGLVLKTIVETRSAGMMVTDNRNLTAARGVLS